MAGIEAEMASANKRRFTRGGSWMKLSLDHRRAKEHVRRWFGSVLAGFWPRFNGVG